MAITLFPDGGRARYVPVDIGPARPGEHWTEILPALLTAGVRQWSPILWQSPGRRKQRAFRSCDFLVLDVDGGLNLADATQVFAPYEHLILASRNHRRAKGGHGEPVDRYRVIIPFASRIDSLAEFLATMGTALAQFPFSDSRCRDGARIYFPGTGEVLSRQRSGQSFPVTAPSADVLDTTHQLLFGVERCKMPASGRASRPLYEIRIPLVSGRPFWFTRLGQDDVLGYARLAAEGPITVDPSGQARHAWLPAARPVFDEVLERVGGEMRRRRGALNRYEPLSRGLLRLSLSARPRRGAWDWLPAYAYEDHEGGACLWVAYDLKGRGEDGVASIDQFVRELRELVEFGRPDLADGVDWNASLLWNKATPLYPAELEGLARWDARVLSLGELRRLVPEEMRRRARETARKRQQRSRRLAASVPDYPDAAATTATAGDGASSEDAGVPGAPKTDAARGADDVDPAEVRKAFDALAADPFLAGLRSLRQSDEAQALLVALSAHAALPHVLPATERDAITDTALGLPIRISGRVLAEEARRLTGVDVTERSARRLVQTLVARGLLLPFDGGSYRPAVRSRRYQVAAAFAGTLGRLREMTRPSPRPGAGSGSAVQQLDAVDGDLEALHRRITDSLGSPRDGHFNDWVFLVTAFFRGESVLQSYLKRFHADFIAAKPERWEQALGAWRSHVTRWRERRGTQQPERGGGARGDGGAA